MSFDVLTGRLISCMITFAVVMSSAAVAGGLAGLFCTPLFQQPLFMFKSSQVQTTCLHDKVSGISS